MKSLENYLDPAWSPGDNPSLRWTAYVYDNFRVVSNVSYHLIRTGGWGKELPNGSWTGFIGLLKSGEAEISIQTPKFRHDRMNALEIYNSAQHNRIIFIFLQPRAFGSFKALVTPFVNESWLLMGIVGIIFILTFRLLAKYAEDSNLASLGYLIILMISSVSGQGFDEWPTQSKVYYSTRIMSLALLIFTFMAYVYYNAAVLNGLLSPNPATITTIDDLLDSTYDLVVFNESYMREFNSDESVYGPASEPVTKRILQKFEKSGFVFLFGREGLKAVTRGHTAYFTDEYSLYGSMGEVFDMPHVCTHTILQRGGYFQGGLSNRKGSPYREMINTNYVWQRENGLMRYSLGKWVKEKPKCEFSLEAVPIVIGAMGLAFSSLGTGVTLGIVFLLWEIFRGRSFLKM